MKLLRLVPSNTNLDFLKLRNYAFIFSIIIILGTLLSLFVNSLNYGIDFKGGILLELRTKNINSSNIDDLRRKISTLEAGEVSIAAVTNDGRVIDETADLIYHLLVTLRKLNLSFSDVLDELNVRSK